MFICNNVAFWLQQNCYLISHHIHMILQQQLYLNITSLVFLSKFEKYTKNFILKYTQNFKFYKKQKNILK